MSHLRKMKKEDSSNSRTQVVEGFKKVQTRLKTLVLTLENLQIVDKRERDEKNSESITKRESFFRELNQIRSQVTIYVNDIQKQIEDLRPQSKNDQNYIDKAKAYLVLVQLAKEILEKLNQLFTNILDQFSLYIDQLWIHMVKHDQEQARRVKREFNQFFNEKTSNSDKLFDDIEQLMDNIDDAQQNWK